MIPILKKNRIQEHIPTYEDPLLTESELDESSYIFSDNDFINIKNKIKSEILSQKRYINNNIVDEEENNDNSDDDNNDDDGSDDNNKDDHNDNHNDIDKDEDEDEDESDGIVLKGKFIKDKKNLNGIIKEKEKVFNTIVLKSTRDSYTKSNNDVDNQEKYQSIHINEEKNSKIRQEEQKENKSSNEIQTSSDWSMLHDSEEENDIWSANIIERLKSIERPKKVDEVCKQNKSSHISSFSNSNSSSSSTPVNTNQEIDNSNVDTPNSSITSVPSSKKLDLLKYKKDNLDKNSIPGNLSYINEEKSTANHSSEIKNKRHAYVYSKSSIPIAAKTNSSNNQSDDYSDFILNILDYFSSDSSIPDINDDDENKYLKNVNNTNHLDTSTALNSHHLIYSFVLFSLTKRTVYVAVSMISSIAPSTFINFSALTESFCIKRETIC